MTTQVMITLPDEVYQQAARFAQFLNRDVESVLSDTLQLSIPEMRLVDLDVRPVSILSDEQVLELTELQMEPDQDKRLSALLDRQQAGVLVGDERSELDELMQVYREGLLRKATALSEAVKRQLIAPLES
jgi:hypothetical protein